jgi:hypothetical protein
VAADNAPAKIKASNGVLRIIITLRTPFLNVEMRIVLAKT